MTESRIGDYRAVCRLCLSGRQDSLKSIFDATLGPNRVPQKIQQLLIIQVHRNDKISTMVCNDCIIRLDTWYSYKRECHRNQTKLVEWLNKTVGHNPQEPSFHIKTEPDDYEANELGMMNGNHGMLPIKVEIGEPIDEEYNDDFPPTLTPHAFDGDEPFYFGESDSPTSKSEDERRCPECGRLFGSVNNMRRHQNMLHRKDKRTPMNEIKKPPPEDELAPEPQEVNESQPENKIIPKIEDDVLNDENGVINISMEQVPINSENEAPNIVDNASEKNEEDVPIEKESLKEELPEVKEDIPKIPEKSNETQNEENQSKAEEKPPDTENDEQKIQFAAGLKLVQKDSTPIEFESLSKIELSYIEKCKAMVSMFHTLQCACHNVQHKTLRNLLSHLRELRIWFPLFTCYSCMISFTDRSTFTKHHSKCPRTQLETLIKLSNLRKRSEVKTRLYQNYKCNRCRFLYSFYDDYCKHIEEEHALGSPPFYCSCRYVFDNLDEYRNHCYNSCVLSYYCDICFITTTTSEDFVKHCQEHHDASEGFVLLQEDGYTPRKTFHHKEADDESNVVEGKRERRKSVKQPILVQIYDNEIPPEPKDIPARVLVRKILNMDGPKSAADWRNPSTCPLCKKEYSSVHNMARHYRTHLERNEVKITKTSPKHESEDDESYYTCPDCGGMYPSSNWLKHLQENHPPKTCNECDKVFQFQSELDQHRSVHLNIKVYRDSKTHSYKSAMVSPSSESNEIVNEVMLMCELCDTMFKSKEDLKNHKLLYHESNISRPSSSMDTFEMNEEAETVTNLETASESDEEIKDSKEGILPQSPSIERHPCESCDRVYSSIKTLKEHMKNKHGTLYVTKTDYPKKCDYCDKMCTTGAALYLHTQMHERMTLNDLRKDKTAIAKAKKKALQEKPLDPDEEEESYHTCKRCFKVFGTKGRLKDHMKCHGISTNRSTPKPVFKKNRKVLCDLCHVALENSDELEQHKIDEHSDELDGMPELTSEMEIDDDVKNPIVYSCDICGDTFVFKFDLKKHKETHILPKIKNTSVYCKYCKIAFNTLGDLSKHMNDEHEEMTKPKITKEGSKSKDSDKIYKCPVCKKGFVSVGAMTAHAGWHKRAGSKFETSEANRPQAAAAAKLARHTKILKKVAEASVSKPQSPFQCTVCFAQLPNNTALQIHILEKHRAVDAVMLIPRCNICNQDFATQDEYDRHKRFHDFLERQQRHDSQNTPIIQSVQSVSHNSTKRNPCNYCNASFSRPDTLNAHIRQHHKEHVKTEFKCSQCDRVFDKQSSLSIHLKVHEKQKISAGPSSAGSFSGKVYSCSICNMGFSFPKDLRMHTINAHPF